MLGRLNNYFKSAGRKEVAKSIFLTQLPSPRVLTRELMSLATPSAPALSPWCELHPCHSKAFLSPDEIILNVFPVKHETAAFARVSLCVCWVGG